MDYIKVSEAAKKWGISPRRIRKLCEENRIEGVIRKGKLYMIPADASKPEDRRTNRKSFTAILKSIDRKLQELSSRRPLTEGEVQRLQEQFIIEYTYNSNAIEGNTLTLQETALVLQGITIDQKPLKDHLEAIGHKEAFLYVVNLVQQKVELSEKIIKDIHSLVLMDKPNDRGVYRRIPVKIMGAYHEPPQPYLVEPKMYELMQKHAERKKSMHLLECLALFHLEFEGIHPFVDGNGRTGRLILNLELMQNGYPPINIKFSDRKKYYEAFDAYYRNNNAGAMTELIAKYVEQRLDEYLAIL
ncbi:MAG TPA: Fic family protein [Clostridiaceae bacterium]|nr:Fic family protein [Clostridiaceae bacterium]